MQLYNNIYFCFLILITFSSLVQAQDNVGIGTPTPNPKALLDLTSPDKGFLVPRLTTVQRDAINPSGSGDAALLIYNTDDNLFYYWDGTQWMGFPVASAAAGYNTSFNFNPTTNELIITDDGGSFTVNLSSLKNTYTAGNGISITGNVITNTGDLSNTNELIGSVVFNPSTNILTITDAGGSYPADLSSLANDWKLTGNTGTNPAVNFLGTTDNQALIFKTNNSERVRIMETGNVGIGTSNPTAPLHIQIAGGTVGNLSSRLIQLTNTNYSWELRVGSGNGWLAWVPDVASNRRWQINNENGITVFNVNVGAPENSFFMGQNGFIEFGLGAGSTRRINLPNIAAVDGRARAEMWETYSDNRIKSNQRTIKYGLAEVLKMQPKSYDHHNSRFTSEGIEISNEKTPSIGFIAQEMYEIIPEVVSKPSDENLDLWSMSYEKLVPVLVKAIQEQNDLINKLSHENELMKIQYHEIKSELLKLKPKMQTLSHEIGL